MAPNMSNVTLSLDGVLCSTISHNNTSKELTMAVQRGAEVLAAMLCAASTT